MTAIDDALARRAATAGGLAPGADSPVPSLHLTILTCMDTRIADYDLFALGPGDAHILRNAGGVVTDDAIRSLAISQRELRTREVAIVQHTSCGMMSITDEGFKDGLAAEAGLRPMWSVEAFRDVHASVLESMQRVRHSPFVPHTDQVRGFIYDVTTGDLTEVRG